MKAFPIAYIAGDFLARWQNKPLPNLYVVSQHVTWRNNSVWLHGAYTSCFLPDEIGHVCTQATSANVCHHENKRLLRRLHFQHLTKQEIENILLSRHSTGMVMCWYGHWVQMSSSNVCRILFQSIRFRVKTYSWADQVRNSPDLATWICYKK